MFFKQAVIIHNPVSGRRSRLREEKIEKACEILGREIPRIEVVTTTAPGDASRLARQAVAGNCDLVAVSGGDGTINEVIAGIVGSKTTLLPLPNGTANVLAELVGMPTQPERAASLFSSLEVYEVPLGRVCCSVDRNNERRFLLMCGIGVDAGIIYSLDTRLKTYLGEGAYWLGSLDHLHRKLEPFGVSLDGKEYEATFVLVSKSRCYGGGLVITPNANLLADKFEVAIFHGRSPLRYVAYLAQIATGRLDLFPDVTFCQTERIELSPIDVPPVYLEVDGEFVGRIPAVIDVAPEKIKLLLPSNFDRKK